MGLFDQLTEARIREWLQRGTDRKGPDQHGTPDAAMVEPMEVQLFKEILALHLKAGKATSEADRRELLSYAGRLETQLMVLLEQNGRPLAARQVADNIRMHLAELDHP